MDPGSSARPATDVRRARGRRAAPADGRGLRRPRRRVRAPGLAAGSRASRRPAPAATSRSRSSPTRAIRALNRAYRRKDAPPTCCRFRLGRRRAAAGASAMLGDIVIATRRGAAPGARGRALRTRPSCGSWRCTACCTCSATITTTSRQRPDGAARAPAAPQGRPARRPDRAASTRQ